MELRNQSESWLGYLYILHMHIVQGMPLPSDLSVGNINTKKSYHKICQMRSAIAFRTSLG